MLPAGPGFVGITAGAAGAVMAVAAADTGTEPTGAAASGCWSSGGFPPGCRLSLGPPAVAALICQHATAAVDTWWKSDLLPSHEANGLKQLR